MNCDRWNDRVTVVPEGFDPVPVRKNEDGTWREVAEGERGQAWIVPPDLFQVCFEDCLKRAEQMGPHEADKVPEPKPYLPDGEPPIGDGWREPSASERQFNHDVGPHPALFPI